MQTSNAFSLTDPPAKPLFITIRVGRHIIAATGDGTEIVDSASRATHGSNTKAASSQKVPIYNLEVAPWEISSASPQISDTDSDEL